MKGNHEASDPFVREKIIRRWREINVAYRLEAHFGDMLRFTLNSYIFQ